MIYKTFKGILRPEEWFYGQASYMRLTLMGQSVQDLILKQRDTVSRELGNVSLSLAEGMEMDAKHLGQSVRVFSEVYLSTLVTVYQGSLESYRVQIGSLEKPACLSAEFGVGGLQLKAMNLIQDKVFLLFRNQSDSTFTVVVHAYAELDECYLLSLEKVVNFSEGNLQQVVGSEQNYTSFKLVDMKQFMYHQLSYVFFLTTFYQSSTEISRQFLFYYELSLFEKVRGVE